MRTHRVERELTDSGAAVDAFSHRGATTTRLKSLHDLPYLPQSPKIVKD